MANDLNRRYDPAVAGNNKILIKREHLGLVQCVVIFSDQLMHLIQIKFNSLQWVVLVQTPTGVESDEGALRLLHLQNLNYKNRQLIIAGDFNLVLNPIDRTGHFIPNTNDKILFPKLLSNFDLIDSYRYLYPNTKTYFFSHSHPTSRLDHIYIPSSLTSKITQTLYHNITFSNHNKAPTFRTSLQNNF